VTVAPEARRAAPMLAGATLAGGIASRLVSARAAAGTLILAVISVVRSATIRRRSVPRSSDYLRAAAARIDAILGAAGEGVPFDAFGHSHIPELHPIVGSASHWYVNAGTRKSGAGSPSPTFVEIDPDGGGPSRPVATLMRWDPATRSSQALGEARG
jgi:hypothetical protein